MKTTWTAVVLALAIIVGGVTSDVLRPQVRTRDDNASLTRDDSTSLTDGSLQLYRVSNRAEASRPDSRVWKGRYNAVAAPGQIAVDRPLANQDVSTPVELAPDDARLARAAGARAPPPTV